MERKNVRTSSASPRPAILREVGCRPPRGMFLEHYPGCSEPRGNDQGPLREPISSKPLVTLPVVGRVGMRHACKEW